MIVVSDTSPLRYLVEVEAIGVLPLLYSDIVTTPCVIAELQFGHFPEVVRTWASHPPEWLRIVSPSHVGFRSRLDEGEATAISLAQECAARLLLIDERAGTAVAREVGIETIGTLGILVVAGARNYLDFDEALDRLLHGSRFRHTPALIAHTRQLYVQVKRARST